jgi:hypothetical protein
MRWTMAWVILLTSLFGCVPYSETYYRLDRSDARYFGGSCLGGVGPPSIAYFPYEGIYLSAAVGEIRKAILVGVHVPAGQKVQLLTRSVVVTYEPPSKDTSTPLELKPAPRRGGTPDPREFRYIEDPYGKEDFFGLLSGETRKVYVGRSETDQIAYKTYQYIADFQDDQVERGAITFPTFRINGKDFEGPRLPFRRSTHVGLLAINC